IVELLIVIVVIGILAALVITTYSGIQAKARNSKRETDINSVQTQIEAYFASNGHYPSFADLSTASWDTTNLKSLDQSALHDPSASTSGITLSQTAGAKVYQYAPLNSGGTSCEADDTTCATYTLTATLESGAGTYTKTNLD
ncbi:MAG TPA: hypothetical protein VFN56_02010, partial [Candidatus Saccharimonadales bacterium]|nr:hypothetical protein [Candidatus Saccharimonadales bacterium]